MSFTLPDTVYSPQQIDAFLVEIDQVLAILREQAVQQHVLGDQAPAVEPPKMSEELQKMLAETEKDAKSTASSMEQLVGRLREIKRQSPVVHITLAAYPGSSVKHSLVGWFRANINDNILVTFNVDRAIIGGALVRTVDHIYDLSFHNMVWSKRARLPEILHNV